MKNKSDKIYSKQSVYEASRDRLRYVFEKFPRVMVAFSAGKDSSVLLHLALEVANEFDNRLVDAVLVDLEGQYAATISHAQEMLALPGVRPWWICLPLNLRNASSANQPYWCCWEPGAEWIRPMPVADGVVSDPDALPFYKERMEFEEFVPAFQEWLADGEPLAALVGIRADESLHRYMSVKKGQSVKKCAFDNIQWSAQRRKRDTSVSFFPIYDWKFSDLWRYVGEKNLPYNRLYDWMYLAGVPHSEMRICQPYGDDQRKGLDLFHKIEPETWFKIVQRVEGANWAAHYARQKFLGYKGSLGLPSAFSTWQQYAHFLLGTLPPDLRGVYERRIQVFIDWWDKEGGTPLSQWPDDGDRKLEGKRMQPSWRRVALSLLKQDMGKSMSFGFARRDADQLIAVKKKFVDL